MVHALNEIWRVLVPGGILTDLRPFGDHWPVEIVSRAEVWPAGLVDGSLSFPDDLAANAAIEHVVATGLFTREQSGSFKLFTYWDTVAEFEAYMDARSSAILPPETLAELTRLQARHGPDARVRTCHSMIIARYRKLARGE